MYLDSRYRIHLMWMYDNQPQLVRDLLRKGKLKDHELIVVAGLTASEPKTKPFAGLAKTFGVERKSVIVLEALSDPLAKSLRNLRAFELCRADDLNAFDVLNTQKVLLTKQAFQRLEERIRHNGQQGRR